MVQRGHYSLVLTHLSPDLQKGNSARIIYMVRYRQFPSGQSTNSVPESNKPDLTSRAFLRLKQRELREI